MINILMEVVSSIDDKVAASHLLGGKKKLNYLFITALKDRRRAARAPPCALLRAMADVNYDFTDTDMTNNLFETGEPHVDSDFLGP